MIYVKLRKLIYVILRRSKQGKNSYFCAPIQITIQMINTVIVDDHELFRLGVRSSLTSRHPEINIVGEAETGEELFDLLKTTSVDLALLDVVLPDISGVDITRRLKKEYPALKILAISSENTAETTHALLDAGVDGFISKRKGGSDELATAIHSVMNGFQYFGKDISDIIYRIFVAKTKTTHPAVHFTEQEKKIIELCREGLPAKLIADRLNIGSRTVETHKNNIFKKLGINSTTEMINYAMKYGMIRMES